ncbi:MAG: DEAD/DEAH box helicase [Anaerolineales bacterium]|nr:DEAD/DEAH box helicase [Anaerolineales bacterium]
MSFQQFAFHPAVAAGVTAAGYTEPTPIQLKGIPPVLAGQDIIGLAQTGTGKTAAFVLPILQRLLTGPRGRVRALIIAPTRELAEQINDTILQLGAQTRLRSVTLYGGVGFQPQVSKLRAGVEIVVACPGRLLDHMNQGTVKLNQLEVLVLDEADRMFDMGFLPDVRRILKALPAQRQTLLYSATMPDDVGKLAREFLRQPVTVKANHDQPLATITHALYPVAAHLKTEMLLALLYNTDTEAVLVFTRTKHRAKRVGQQLERAGFKATSLQGNLSQNRRLAAMAGFRDGSYQIMVATDIAARGIDVSQITHVINYDMPDTPEAYTHRIGRTGRAARTGDAFTLTTTEDHEMVRAIEKVMGQRLERRTLPNFDYNAKPADPHAGGRPSSQDRIHARVERERRERPAPRQPAAPAQGAQGNGHHRRPAAAPSQPAGGGQPSARPRSGNGANGAPQRRRRRPATARG